MAYHKPGDPCSLEKVEQHYTFATGVHGRERYTVKHYKCGLVWCPYPTRMCRVKVQNETE